MFNKGKFIGIALGFVGLVLFSLLTMYVLTQAEKGKAEEVFESAQGSLSSLYETIEIQMKDAKKDGLLTLIDEKAVASAQLSLNDTEKRLSNLNGAHKENVKQELLPKMKGIEEYNVIVPIANQLQSRIHDTGKKVKDNPLDPGLSKKFTSLKEELAEFTELAAKIDDPSIKEFFQSRYKPQITRLEDQVTSYQNASNKIAELKSIAEKLSLPKGEFDQKVSKLSEEVAHLPYSNTNAGLQEEIKKASKEYETNRIAQEEKKRAEEKRLAEEKKKVEDKAEEETDEIFPMTFTMTSSSGFETIFSREPYGERYDDIDEIARRHGGRYYYVPESDVAAIFDENRKALAGLNYGFSTSVEYKELFIDLYAYYTGTSRDDAAALVGKVIDTGEPIETGEGNVNEGGSRLWTESGELHYDLW
ncbi:hypothetical protein AAEO50_01300 [Rossellomorea oryzaecorticis]|uniref:Uncharacterized protein n=1 Tax=Rossellomorea oryzaecorticis TaxID=1396505 RepID=A0ABU9K4A6_9BACI